MFVMATWGLNIVAVKYLTQYMDARILAAVRIVIALLVVTLIIKARGGRIPKLTRAQLGWLALAGFLVVYAHQAALVAGLGLTSAANGTLIMATSPLLSAVLAAVFYRERLTPARVRARCWAWPAWRWWCWAAARRWARPAGAMPWSSWRWWCSCAAGW